MSQQADKYRRFAEQCRELSQSTSGDLKQQLEAMATVWDELARSENPRLQRATVNDADQR